MSLQPGEIIAIPYAGWRDKGACRNLGPDELGDPDPYFAVDRGEIKEAKRICRTLCPVRDECLRYAMANGERYGVWGGETWSRRHRLARDYHGTPEHWQQGCRCPHCNEAQARRRAIGAA